MTKDDRVPFEEAVGHFQSFLSSENWSPSLLWLSSDRITGHKRNYWIFRPEELDSSDASRTYYEETRKEDWNLAIVAFAPYKNFTLAFVDRGPGKSRMMNLQIDMTESNYHFVHSKIYWQLIRILCLLRGKSPFLNCTGMTPHK
jgi:hypothetical protein